MSSSNLTALRRHKYVVLLALLLAGLATQSFNAQPGAGGLLVDVFRTVLGAATLFVVFERPRERATMTVIFVSLVAVGWGRHIVGGNLDYPLSLAYDGLLAIFLWAAVWVILRGLVRTPAVGAENVLGAICGYLLAGDAWSGLNAFTYLLMPAAYSINPDLNALLADWHGRLAVFSYYSLAQMLTIGYADVTPVRAPATTLSLFGALFGMFYTAIVVSQFVSLAQAGKRKGHGAE